MWGEFNIGGGARITVLTASSFAGLPTGSVGDIGIVTTQQIGNVYIGNEAISSPVNNDISIETAQMNNACPIIISAGSYPLAIYPHRCMQYSGGVWVVREFYVKKSTGWTAPYAYLYYSGQEFSTFSGSWQVRKWASQSGLTTASSASLVKNSDHMLLSGSGNNYGCVVAEIVSDIDLTNYKTLVAVINNTSINSNYASDLAVRMAVVSRTATYWQTGSVDSVGFSSSTGSDQTKSIDVTSMNGSYDIVIGFQSMTATGCSTKIKDVRLIS